MYDRSGNTPDQKRKHNLLPTEEQSADCHQLNIPASDSTPPGKQIQYVEEHTDSKEADSPQKPVTKVQCKVNQPQRQYKKIDPKRNLLGPKIDYAQH